MACGTSISASRNLVANSHGYYVAKNWEEVERYVASLRQRASSILAVAQSYY